MQRLDNRFPPTWDLVSPEADDPYADPESFVRFTQGHDTWHYSVDQRFIGDLMRRDLLLQRNLQQQVVDYSLRPPIQFHTQPVTVRAGTSVLVAGFQIPADCTGVLIMAEMVARALYGGLSSDMSSYAMSIIIRGDTDAPTVVGSLPTAAGMAPLTSPMAARS